MTKAGNPDTAPTFWERHFPVLPPPVDDRPEYLRVFFPADAPKLVRPPRVLDGLFAYPYPSSSLRLGRPRPRGDESAAKYVAAALAGEADAVATTPEGSRNHRLNAAAYNLGQLVGGGEISEEEVIDTLTQAAEVAGLGSREIDRTLRSGLEAGKRYPRRVPERAQPTPVTILEDSTPVDTTGEPRVDAHDFWEAREVLAHLRTFAQARRAAPWAVLGVALARVVVATPPAVVLPAMVGSHASLNIFVAAVAPSGGGKGAAVGAATDALGVGDVTSCQVGSGEGLTHAFVRRVKGVVEQHTSSVFANVAEVDTVAALTSRQGATLLPVLRQAYMGEDFGFTYADPTKRLTVPAHRYRLCMVVGVQPERAGGLLDDSDGGTPQRFLWLPATDRHAPQAAPEAPDRASWSMPRLPHNRDRTHGRFVLTVCDTARASIDTARLARLRGEGDALDGHALLTQLKVAAALALLDRRLQVSEEDWQLAQVIMQVSDSTRAGVAAGLDRANRARNRARGEAEAERTVLTMDRVDAREVTRVKRSIVSKLRSAKAVGIAHADLRRSLASRDRPHFQDAMGQLIEVGQVTVHDIDSNDAGGGGQGHRYLLTDQAVP